MDAEQFAQFMTGLNGIFAQLQRGQQDLANAIQGLPVAQQATGQQAQPQLAVPQFALTPGQTNPGQFIDYSSSTGMKLWNEATASLPNKFSADGKEVNKFSEAMMERAEKSGWRAQGGNIIEITVQQVQINLLTEYGRITVADISAHCATYINANNRQSQNDTQMYHCIKNSLTPEAEIKILAERSKYHIGDTPCGPLLYKLLMQKAIVDIRATGSLLRSNLIELDSYMSSIKSDVQAFNNHVKLNYEGLKTRGEECPDLMIHLFKAYQAVTDKEFLTYIRLKKIAYDDGTAMTPEELMDTASAKFTMIKNQGQWNKRSAEEEQVVALSAKFDELQDANLKLSKQLAKKKEDKGKDKNDKDGPKKKQEKKKAKKEDKWAWKSIKPTASQSQTKTVEGKEYHWCPYHDKWTQHDPKDDGPNRCRLKPVANSATVSNNQSQANADAQNQALAAVINAFEDRD